MCGYFFSATWASTICRIKSEGAAAFSGGAASELMVALLIKSDCNLTSSLLGVHCRCGLRSPGPRLCLRDQSQHLGGLSQSRSLCHSHVAAAGSAAEHSRDPFPDRDCV